MNDPDLITGGRPADLKIGFDAKRAFYNRSGLGNYSRNLITSLSVNYPGNSYFLFTPAGKHRVGWTPTGNCTVVEPKSMVFRIWGSAWRSKFITTDIVNSGISIYHGLSHELPAGIEKTGVKSVVTIHDIIFLKFPELYKKVDVEIYRRKLLYACRVADSIVAISNQTGRDLTDMLNVDPARISVIYQGYNSSFLKKLDESSRQQFRLKYKLPEKFLLTVGTIEERKNLLTLIEALHINGIDMPLVVIGRKVEPYFTKIAAYIRQHDIRNIIFLNTIENEDLPGFYQTAECFIYPSVYEGFGIPIIEALVSEVPVITSTGGCFSEAGGPGTIYTDPKNPEMLGSRIMEVLGNPEVRRNMISTGAEYVSRFKNRNIAENYMKLYRSLV